MPGTIEERLDAEKQLAMFMSEFYNDPLGFVLDCYPWGKPGSALEVYPDGPDVWQRDILEDIGRQVRERAFDGVNPVLPIRIGVASGRGAGKGALVGWIVDWIMSTRPNAIGTVTANTSSQLEEKTWAAIRTWTKRCLTAHWFEINSAVMFRKGKRESWKVTPQSCDPSNTDSFQGQHNALSTSFMIFDEASGIDDGIFKAAEGGLTDGEPMIFIFFNPTKNTGYAYNAVFENPGGRWTTRIIDSRTCKMPNKAFIQEWLDDCGGDENADFFRVHVRGLPPLASELQFIDADRIKSAQSRSVEVLPNEPLVAGVDISGGGGAWTVCRFRRGLDARAVAPIRLNGDISKDRNNLIARLAQVLSETDPSRQVSAMFIDFAFGAAIVERLHAMGYTQVFEVNFGADAPDQHMANMRAMMWNKMKDWLLRGAIPKDDMWLSRDLAKPGYHHDRRDRLLLESKESMAKRGLASPDDGDGLALTFAMPVSIARAPSGPAYRPKSSWG